MRKRKFFKRQKNHLIYGAILVSVRLIRLMDRMTAIRLMRRLSRLVYRLDKTDRILTIQNLTAAFPEKTLAEIETIAQAVFANLAVGIVDFIRLPLLVRQGLDRLVTVDGFHHMQEAHARGKGVIALTAHFGNWELLAAWVAQHLPLKAVGANAYDARLDRLITEIRSAAGYVDINRGHTRHERSRTTREVIRSLQQRYVIGVLLDQDTRVEGVFVDFFGRLAHTPSGPIRLAQRYAIPMVPAFIRLNANFTYHAVFYEPIVLENTGDLERDLVINTQKCSDIYERVIRAHPEQWVWMHQRWRKKPTDIN